MSKSSKSKWPKNMFFEPAAIEDFSALDGTQKIEVYKALIKVAKNPQPRPKGYGKPLGKDLASYMKIKLRDSGIRIIYRLEPHESDNMNIYIIGMRSDSEVYNDILRRL